MAQSYGRGSGVSEMLGRYSALADAGIVYSASAIVTAPVIYTTAAGTGGPLLHNPLGSGVNAHLLMASVSVTVVTTVAAALGITGAGGQVAAPSATTTIDSKACTRVGLGNPSVVNAYRVGTVTNAGTFLLPFAQLHTGALTVDNNDQVLIDLGGLVVVPPGSWASIAASATATTTVGTFGLVWAEVPY